MGDRANAKNIRIKLKRGTPEAVDAYHPLRGELVVARPGTTRLRVGGSDVGGVEIPLLPSITETPSITAPIDGSTGISLTPVIQSTMYQGTEDHQATYWQVSESGNFNSLVVDTGWDSVHLTELPLDDILPLERDTVYFVRCRHRNNIGSVSGWSPAISFDTKATSHVAQVSTLTWENPTNGDDGEIYWPSDPGYTVSRDGRTMAMVDGYGTSIDSAPNQPIAWIKEYVDGAWSDTALVADPAVVGRLSTFVGRLSPTGNTLAIISDDFNDSIAKIVVFRRENGVWAFDQHFNMPNHLGQTHATYAPLWRMGVLDDMLVTAQGYNYNIYGEPGTFPTVPDLEVYVWRRGAGGWTLESTNLISKPNHEDNPRQVFVGDIRVNDDGSRIFLSNPYRPYAGDASVRPLGDIAEYAYNGVEMTLANELRVPSEYYVGKSMPHLEMGWTMDINATGDKLCALDYLGGLYVWSKSLGSWTLDQFIAAPNGEHATTYGVTDVAPGNFSFAIEWYSYPHEEALSMSADGSGIVTWGLMNGGGYSGGIRFEADDQGQFNPVQVFDSGSQSYPLPTPVNMDNNMSQVWMGDTKDIATFFSPNWGPVIAEVLIYR